MSDLLEAARVAAEARGMAERSYRSAVLAAVRVEGVPAVSRGLGVSRQAVRQLVLRAGADAGRLRERLEELDARWAELVAWRAGAYVLRDASAVTAGRNGQARKRARKGLGPLPTVRSEALALAEVELLELVAEGEPVEGFDVEVIARELAEAEALRCLLESAGDGIPF